MAPFHRTTEHGTNELPVTVSVNAGEPAATEVCDSEVILGAGRLVAGVVMVNGNVFDVADEFETETPAGPGNAVSVAEIVATRRVELTKVVARGKPFQFTTEPWDPLESTCRHASLSIL